ncbi:MAG: PilZ domain-containing protein [Archangium sp.]|nr:PilZ domain-containing protein [Archangium sp.]
MGADQRQFQRKAVKVDIQARDAHGGGELVFQSADVSRGGAFLEADLLLEQGESLALEFTLPGSGPLRAQARVAWVRRFPADGEPAGMGLEFVSMDEADRRALKAFLDA